MERLIIDFASLFRSCTISQNLDTVHRCVFLVHVTLVNIGSRFSQPGMVERDIGTAVGRIRGARGPCDERRSSSTPVFIPFLSIIISHLPLPSIVLPLRSLLSIILTNDLYELVASLLGGRS